MSSYEVRPHQQRLAEGIERVFTHEGNWERDDDGNKIDLRHFLGQAPTGSGKALAHLIPSILSGKRVIVSVTTKALQDQIERSDLPFLREHLCNFDYAVLKGQGSYLCPTRMLDLNDADTPSLSSLRPILSNPPTGFFGERTQIEAEIGPIPDQEWAQMCSTTEDCRDCKPDHCFAKAARARAKVANIVVVNHSVLFTDLMLRRETGKNLLLGRYDAVVMDEAHAAADVATNCLGGEIKQFAVRVLDQRVTAWANQNLSDPSAVLNAMGQAVENFDAAWALVPDKDGETLKVDFVQGVLAEPLLGLLDALAAVYKAVGTADLSGADTKASKRRKVLMGTILNLTDKITYFLTATEDECVRWVNVTKRKTTSSTKAIQYAPIDVAPFLYEHLFSQVPCILVSATLKVNGSFDYIAQELGIPNYEGLEVGSSFDYARQGRIYVPTIPAPAGSDQAAWQAAATIEIQEILRNVNGRALVLFTSIAHMRQASDMCRNMPGLQIRTQGEAPTGELVAWLRHYDESDPDTHGRVIMATKSFFTGVDIPGMNAVIITKMPFPRPNDPLVAARMEKVERSGQSSFSGYSMPVMSLDLQQAAGRLIRKSTDRGVIAVLDPRLADKGYGRKILRDLPPMTMTRSLAEAVEVFGGLG